MHQPSPEQAAIYRALRETSDSLLIEAVAGAGKTTTLVGCADCVPRSASAVFLAFNKNIAMELERRLPPHVTAKTFHSHAYAALKRNLGASPKVDDDKTKTILKELLPSRSDYETYFAFVSRLVGYAKAAGYKHFPDVTLAGLCRHFNHYGDSEDFDESRAFRIANDVLDESAKRTSVIDFNDMLWLALLRGVAFDKANYVFVDEGQDTNAVQAELLARMVAKPPYGRVVIVGDPNQAIYGFRGAGTDSLDALAERFACRRLGLSVSWRCSQAVVKEAQAVLQTTL